MTLIKNLEMVDKIAGKKPGLARAALGECILGYSPKYVGKKYAVDYNRENKKTNFQSCYNHQ